jgi:putative ATP-binding cassette transporter
MVFIVIGVIIFLLPSLQGLRAPTLTGYTLALLYLMSPMQTIMNMLPSLSRATVALQRVKELGFELDKRASETNCAQLTSPPSWKSLEFKSVTHVYRREGESQDFTVGPLEVTFQAGEVIFIIGGNGSGKTTFVKLLTGLYAPETGQICVDGQPVTEENREQYRQRFSAVFSDFYLFEQLLGEDEAALDSRALAHLKQLKLTDKVKVKDGRLSTIDLSQGQRKRLALLAAYLEDRPIYVFDEWAADQDPYFKSIFYLQLVPELKAKNKTLFIVSHDDKYYDIADRLVKMEDGQITSDMSYSHALVNGNQF